jgi:hypothetical protein
MLKTYSKMRKINSVFLLIIFNFCYSQSNKTVSNNTPKFGLTNKIDSKWLGNYYFESFNKDNLKTSFDISIQDLNNIKIVYIGDGEKPEFYKNLKFQLVKTDKLKIIFNPKYESLGIIFLENSDKKYYISGEVISFINPGSDSLEIKKKKCIPK